MSVPAPSLVTEPAAAIALLRVRLVEAPGVKIKREPVPTVS